MPRQVIFTVQAQTTAAPEVVYRLLADGASWPGWSPIGSFRLEREGSAGGESVGAIRVFTTAGLRSREELLELRPAERLSYTSLSGLPIRAHRADVELTGQDGGTAISWREDFVPRLAGRGPVLRWLLRRFVQRCADGLAAAAAAAGADPGAGPGSADPGAGPGDARKPG
jgi:uncharacterized protein YndB with AHSA1/START domain